MTYQCKTATGDAAGGDGTWPKNCAQRAFVEGVKWWQFHRNRSTAFPSERDEAEKEAVRRYGEPSLSPEMSELVAGLREEAEYSEHYGGLVYVNNNNLIQLLDALEGKSL